MQMTLPDFSELGDHELRRRIADFEFQRDVASDFLARAEAELRHRKQDLKEGIFKSAVTTGGQAAKTKPH